MAAPSQASTPVRFTWALSSLAMGYGILEDTHLEHVPGTALLSDLSIKNGKAFTINEADGQKRGLGRDSHIVLIPQPSDDPEDPLALLPELHLVALLIFSKPELVALEEGGLFLVTVGAFAASLDGALSPMVGPGYQVLSAQFGVTVDDVASTFGAILVGLASFMLVQNATAAKYGHRIVYLFSVTLMFISCIWCAASPNLTSIRASRVFQGFGMSALQSLVASTIEQIYFVHERGSRSIIWSFSILSGITLGPLIYGYVIQNLTWQWGFWLVSIPIGISCLLIFFFVPETTYHRAPVGRKAERPRNNEKDSIDKITVEMSENETPLRRSTYWSQLKIWNGTFSDANIFLIFMRPFPFLFSPVTWFMFFTHGMQTAWLSLLPICSSTIFRIEYGFDASQTGLTNLGGLVGIILGMCFCGYLTDWWAVWISKRNNGIYEPEFRIFFVLTMLTAVFGYAGWAVGTTHNMPWIGAVACLAMANFSMVVAGSASVTYLLDTHGPNALHILALSNFGKNLVIYGFSFFVNGMVARRGVKTSLLILAACQAACWLASVPMYIYGKRVRSWIARNEGFFLVGGRQT